MWRQRAVGWATIAVAIVLVLACVVWALLAQTMSTPACDMEHPPAKAGPLKCSGGSSTKKLP